jgi:hypothetical protein
VRKYASNELHLAFAVPGDLRRNRDGRLSSFSADWRALRESLDQRAQFRKCVTAGAEKYAARYKSGRPLDL